MKTTYSLLLLLVLVTTGCKRDKDTPPAAPVELTDKVLTANLSFPWEILWGPDGFIWMTERGGRISRVNPTNGTTSLLHTINEVTAQGEGGLLGMALHPDFNTTPQVFVVYNYMNAGNYREKVVRFTYNSGALSNPTILLDNLRAANNHNGSRLAFGPDKKLYISTGDAQDVSLPQNLSSLSGKILRIDPSGTIPSDNPNAGSAVWSFGHRNAQGLVWVNNKLYSSEHGASSDDEINIIQKGRNFGWPTVQGFCDNPSEQSFCTDNQVVQPLKAWTPTVAVCGLDYYNNDRIPQWKNNLLLCSLKGNILFQLKLGDNGEAITTTTEYYKSKFGRLRDICISPEGKVYICTSNGNNTDKIIEIDSAKP